MGIQLRGVQDVDLEKPATYLQFFTTISEFAVSPRTIRHPHAESVGIKSRLDSWGWGSVKFAIIYGVRIGGAPALLPKSGSHFRKFPNESEDAVTCCMRLPRRQRVCLTSRTFFACVAWDVKIGMTTAFGGMKTVFGGSLMPDVRRNGDCILRIFREVAPRNVDPSDLGATGSTYVGGSNCGSNSIGC